MIPGSNILNQALRLIARQAVTYFQYVSRETNEIGLDVPVFEESPVKGRVEAVPRKLQLEMGLDLQANYINFFAPVDIIDVQRNVTGDQLSWNGRQWQCLSATPWYAVDGWTQVLCIDIGEAISDPDATPKTGNILKQALRMIARQAVHYFRFIQRAVNDIGMDESVFDSPSYLAGSIQPVPKNLYAYLGLDLQKNYINFFVEKDVMDVARNVSGDQLSWSGRQWQALSATPWYALDGWLQILCVDVGPEADVGLNYTWGFDSDHANFDNGNFNDA